MRQHKEVGTHRLWRIRPEYLDESRLPLSKHDIAPAILLHNIVTPSQPKAAIKTFPR
jgi:hypothetical protein